MLQLLERFYKNQEIFLKKSGACFWFPKITEERYFLLRMGSGLLCLVCGLILGHIVKLPSIGDVVLALAGGVLGYFLPRVMFIISDTRDNQLMMADVRKLYEYVKIQVKAGMHLTHTLAACYMAISNPRLKRALLELNSRLIATNSIPVSVTEFGEKFTNEYISYFCLIILQSEQSGRMTKMLEDITKQMEDMQRFLMTQKRGRMERKVIFLTLLVFVGILMIAGYQLAVSLFQAMSGILG